MASVDYLKAATHLWPTIQSFVPTIRTFFSTHPILSLQSWLTYYASVDPLHTAICICILSSTGVYVAQQATGNASQVDRIWTFAPVWYGAHFALQPVIASKIIAGGWAKETLNHISNDPVAKINFWGKQATTSGNVTATLEPRLALMLALQLLWSARLTFNAYRRGFFKVGEEDYRWPELRKMMARWQWELFAFFFIAIAQNILLAITALPQYMILSTTFAPRARLSTQTSLNLGTADYVLTAVFLANLGMEFLSDHQQQVYQNWKRGYKATLFGMPQKRAGTSSDKQVTKSTSKDEAAVFGRVAGGDDQTLFTEDDRKRGFVTKGLWGWSRHPNFACEQLVWWLLYLFVPITFAPSLFGYSGSLASFFGISRPHTLREMIKLGHALVLNYAVISPFAMNLLFASSTAFTEKMTKAKYPAYGSYQKIVAPFNPLETILRKAYFELFAGDEEKRKVKEEVWGKPTEKRA